MLTRTACGLWVLPGVPPREWPNLSWTTEVADVAGDQEELDALALVQQELRGHVGTRDGVFIRDTDRRFITATDVAFASLHPGSPDRVTDPLCDTSRPEVTNGELDDWQATPPDDWSSWTVCGVLENQWRCVRWEVDAVTGRHAVYVAWRDLYDQTGEDLLVAAVHPGTIDGIEVFGLADPWATPDTMYDTLVRWGLS